MPVMDEFKEERAALKNGTLKQKISYFIYYYKWHVIVAAAIIAFAVSMIHQMVTQKENAFYAALINSLELETAPEFNRGFTEYAGIDTSASDIIIDTSLRIDFSAESAMAENTMVSSQKLMVYIAAGEIDVLIADKATTDSYAYNDTFYDLNEFLTPEQIEKYSPYFYYIDQAYADRRNAMDPTDEAYATLPEFPDPKDPASMEQPVAVGIYLDEAEKLKENYYFFNDEVILSAVVNSNHPEAASAYIDYIFQ